MRQLQMLAIGILLLSYPLFSQTWTSFTTANGLSDNQIRCLTTDSSGTVWIGTRTRGIQGFNGSNFIAFSKNSSLPQTGGNYYEITALEVLDGKMYIGVKSSATLGGLWVYTFATDAITWIGTFEIVGGQDVLTFYKARNGQIYGGSGNGFYKRVTDNSWTRIGTGWCRSIAEKSDGTIYYTTFDSLYRYDGTTKKGIKSGLFYSVAFDATDIGYVSGSSDIYKLTDTTLTALGYNGYAKSIVRDKQGKVWIAGASVSSFGLRSISGTTVTTYTNGNSPLLSMDLAALCITPDNKKIIGHYNAGLNTLADAAVVLPIQISPTSVNLVNGGTQLFTAQYGTRPYRWAVAPANLGTFDTSGATATFRAARAGSGTISVSSGNGADTARASVTIADTGIVIKLPPTGFAVTKGKYADRVDIAWVEPGEFRQGFEDGLPANWKTNPPAGQLTSWVSSPFSPKAGSKCIKFDVYSPGTPITDWLITEKIHVSPEKPTLTLWIRTAYALGNTFSSYLKLSTTGQAPASFTTTIKELTPSYLADSNLVWKFLTADLSAYVNQDVYLALQCAAEDIIIYVDDMKLTGQSGLTAIGRAVRSYKLYRGASPTGLQTGANVIRNNIATSYTDATVTPLQRYYYGVSAVYDSGYETAITPPSLGIAYQQGDSLILNPASSTAPAIDGVINSSEYSDAFKTILTKNGYWGDLYLKVSGNKFYLAADFFGDTTLTNSDEMIFAFDKNRDFTYTDSIEGFYRIQKLASGVELAYFPYMSPFGFTNGYVNPTGMQGNVTAGNGRVQYEMALDLATSFLRLPPNRRIGAYVNVFDAKNNLDATWLERLLAGEYSITGFGSFTLPPVTDIRQEAGTPTEYGLAQNYPNPFNPSTAFSFSIAERGMVTLAVYDVLGNVVEVLANREMEAGTYKASFNASRLGSGTYIYRLEAGGRQFSRKMILVK